MLERMMTRYLSWGGLFVVAILVCAAMWNWRLLSVAMSFTGLLAVALAAIADSAEDGDRDEEKSK